VNLLFDQKFTDLCYGYHAFWRYCLEYLDLSRLDGFEVDTAIYLQAVRRKLKIIDVPSYEGFRFYGIGKLQTFPDGWRVLRTIFREWLVSLRGPGEEAHVGFRDYSHKPVFPEGILIPVTGSVFDGRVMIIDHNPTVTFHRFTLDELIRLLLAKPIRPAPQTCLSDLLMFVMADMGASSGSLVVLDEKADVLSGYLAYGKNIRMIDSRGFSALRQGICGWVIQNRKPVIVHSTLQDPRWFKQPWEEKEGTARSAVVIPFTENDRVLGVLTLTRPDDRHFTEKELERVTKMVITV